MKKLNLCFITISYPYSNKETYLSDEISNLGKVFNSLVCPLKYDLKQKNPLKIIDLLNRNFLFLVKEPYKLLSSFLFVLRKSSGKKFFRNVIFLGQIYQIYLELKDKDIDHIHAYWASSPALAAILLSSWLNIEYSFTMHRYDIEENDFLLFKISKAKFVRAISTWSKSRAIALDPKIKNFEEKIHVIFLGQKCPKNKLLKKKNNHKIVFPADFVSLKGHQYFFEAIKLLKKKISISADLYGSGPLKNSLLKRIKKSKLEAEIKLHGRIDHEKLLGKYDRGEYALLVNSSLVEGLPISIIEASLRGIPFVATDVGATSEIISNNHWLVGKANSKALAEKIFMLLTSTKLEKISVANYKEVSVKFNSEECTKKIISLIKK